MRQNINWGFIILVMFIPMLILGQDQIVPSIEKIPLPDSLKKTGIITKTITFSKQGLKFHKEKLFNTTQKYKNKSWDVVELEGTILSTDVFKPMLPARVIRVAIPWSTQVVSYEAIPRDSFIVSGKYKIIPGQPEMPSSLQHNNIGMPLTIPDSAIYNSFLPYPGKLIQIGIQWDRLGQGFATFIFYPLQYIPAHGKLILYTRIEFKVTYGPTLVEPKEKPPKSINPEIIKELENLKKGVINPEDMLIPVH